MKVSGFLIHCLSRKNDSLFQYYSREKANDAIVEAERIMSGELKPSEEELFDILQRANSWIWYISRGQEDLYEEYCYRLFRPISGEYYIARGKEERDIHR